MKAISSILFSALAAVPVAVHADPVYRCVQNGVTVFTDDPTGPSCTRMDLQVYQPSPEELARIEQQKRLQAEQERAAQAQAAKDRLYQAQMEAARAQQQQAQAMQNLANQQAFAAQQRQAMQLMEPEPYGIWGGYYSPYSRPFPIPDRPLYPGKVPLQPPSGNYPYGADQITVGGGQR